jgi:acid stress-induced BolA-like protein IbaG/YrbA
MISNQELEQKIKQCKDLIHVEVTGDGYHYHLLMVSDVFVGKTRVSREKWVYALLKDDITTGHLHALTMKTLTRDEWEKGRG